ncbi:CRISPR-associated endonuclease Cas2 [Devosia sp. 63-57]|uniref:CRISPR-associated endoribonuclease Cas2 n=2 Tax=Devosia equisanguinis TaxID=2490941 RepID=A0A3S4CB74_9HYPH|nr:CRISPR-associated endonuclease Cas2 [Devosia sp. 63-57]VDS04169.1 CRISPR-associated endoribonuclease Cas2 [Devosia equisanguinis]
MSTPKNPSNKRAQKANSGATHLSGYQLMWMLVTFDLPVETKQQRAAATKFRLALLDLGFEMSQFSNYLRFCKGKEQFEAYVRKIETHLPSMGNVYIFPFTDRQYENIVRFSDQGRRTPQKNPGQLALF